jgi:hypothetical protein
MVDACINAYFYPVQVEPPNVNVDEASPSLISFIWIGIIEHRN